MRFFTFIFFALVQTNLVLANTNINSQSPEFAAKTEVTEKQLQEDATLLNEFAKKEMLIDAKTKAQGEFFYVVLKGFKEEPKLWFNQESYPVFKIPNKQHWNSIIGNHDHVYYRALIPVENLTKPGTYSILVKDDSYEEKQIVTVTDNKRPISRITLSGEKSSINASDKELREVARGLKEKNDKKIWQGKFMYPCVAPKSSPFGVKRSYNGGPVVSYHKGLDFAARLGDAVMAPADGKVVLIGKEKDGYNVHGNTVILDHGHGVTSIYMHLSKINVRKAQDVYIGEKIGEVGDTGISTGPHLHWGIYLSGTSINPELFVENAIE